MGININGKVRFGGVPIIRDYIPDGYNLWLKADSGVTVINDNEIVQWVDQTGTNVASTQNSGFLSYLDQNSINGLPSISINGWRVSLLLSNRITNARSIFIVAKNISNPTTSLNEPILGDTIYSDFRGGTNGYLFESASANIMNGAGYINGILTSPSNMMISTSFTLYELITVGDVRFNSISLDRGYATWRGNYAEIIIYPSEISTENRLFVENYLLTKYNL